jgi:anti-anti-sigma regulatory factor
MTPDGVSSPEMRTVDASTARAGSTSRQASFPVKRLGERLAVVTAGARLDEQHARAFAQAVLRSTSEGVRELVLDLSAVRQYAWPAVYALCELEAHLLEACCAPVAVAADEQLVRDLEAVGLERAWSLCGSLPEALADLLRRPA